MRISDVLAADPFSDLPLSADEVHLLVNREEIKERIDALVHSAGKGFPQNVALLGEDGTGKTSLLNFAEAKAKLVSGFFVSHIDVVGIVVRILNNNMLGEGGRLSAVVFIPCDLVMTARAEYQVLIAVTVQIDGKDCVHTKEAGIGKRVGHESQGMVPHIFIPADSVEFCRSE